MSSDQPYNSLGQILSQGGEIAVGLSLLRGGDRGSVLLLIGRRFGPMQDADREALVDFSQRMIDAGATISESEYAGPIPPEAVPLNQYLFGGTTEGRRSIFTVEVEFPGAEGRVEMRLTFPDLPTQEELREAALGRGGDIVTQYPEKFGLPPGSTVDSGKVYILLPERAF